MNGWQWQREDEKAIRIVTPDEEAALLDAAEALYGPRMRAFIYVALNSGGRRGELVSLQWTDIDLEDGSVLFRQTKGRRDRRVPVNPEVVAALRRLQALTLQEGGPFVGMNDNLGRRWARVIRQAGVSGVSIHDLRRTYITRLIRAGVPLPTVQRLAGHADIKTTLAHYNWVSDADLREGVAKLRKAGAAG